MPDTVFIEPERWPQSIAEIATKARLAGWSKAECVTLWQTHDLMAELFSGRYRGSGRPFINHLAGTSALALHHKANSVVVLAGYAHAAYEQGEFGRDEKGSTAHNRAELLAVIGPQAEEMVFGYVPFQWFRFAKQATDEDVLGLSEVQRDILFLQIVNALDDSCDAAVYPPKWRQGCCDRLVAGARFAALLGYCALANQIHRQLRHLAEIANDDPDLLRPKRSVTVASKPAPQSSFLDKVKQGKFFNA